jgi:hypothetical protein
LRGQTRGGEPPSSRPAINPIIRRLPSKGWFTAILYQSVVTFEQAVSVVLEMARDQQRPYYVIERVTGWAITTYKPKRRRVSNRRAAAA